MTKRPARHLRSLIDPANSGLETLEQRRMMDAALAGDEYIEITRLDGGETIVIEDEDPEYDLVDETGDEPGSDADLYSFTTRPAGERPRDTEPADEEGDDHDLYDFGQDRGEEIDDEAEYTTGDDVYDPPAAPVADLSTVPAAVETVEPAPQDEPSTLEEEPVVAPIALIPDANTIRWIGEPAAAMASPVAIDATDSDAPATWADLAALPALADPVIAIQA